MVGKIVIILQSFLSFWVALDENMAHNIFASVLDLRYKGNK
jgi:hypothetical protein